MDLAKLCAAEGEPTYCIALSKACASLSA